MTLQTKLEPEVQILRERDDDATSHIKNLLFNDKPEKFAKWEKLMNDPIFANKYNLTLD